MPSVCAKHSIKNEIFLKYANSSELVKENMVHIWYEKIE